jgi:uncharacterized integral membrane protein
LAFPAYLTAILGWAVVLTLTIVHLLDDTKDTTALFITGFAYLGPIGVIASCAAIGGVLYAFRHGRVGYERSLLAFAAGFLLAATTILPQLLFPDLH